MQEVNDERTKRPDVERQYEDYLHDEEIYVSEGTWDRFPQGSRLFVGQFRATFNVDTVIMLTL